MLSAADTIVAIATPAGRSALGIVRLSGPQAKQIAHRLLGDQVTLPPRRATFARVGGASRSSSLEPRGTVGDQLLATFFPSPHSATGEDVVELSAHGNPVILGAIVQASIGAGARLAEPGEFSLRGYLHGKVDLVQAEAVRDLIEARTPLQARTAFEQLEGGLTDAIRAIEAELFDLIARLEASLDFPDEGYHFVEPGHAHLAIGAIRGLIGQRLSDARRGRLIREGARVAILGTPNVGKSSLFNRLLNAERAITSEIPGTTRDVISEQVDVHGFVLSLIDTAGVRETVDCVEREGVARARAAAAGADLCLLVVDASRPLAPGDRELLRVTPPDHSLLIVNKTDLPRAWDQSGELAWSGATAEVAATTGAGFEELARAIVRRLNQADVSEFAPGISNVRHITLLESADRALERAEGSLGAIAIPDALGSCQDRSASSSEVPEEFVLVDLHDAALHLQEVTGRRTSDDLLQHVFARFCLGK